MKTYNKLVRDRIPEVIESEGRRYLIETLSDVEYEQALRDKLIEEAREVAQSTDELAQELADMYEVLDALMALHSLTEEQLRALQAQRRAERGSFSRRIRLVWTE